MRNRHIFPMLQRLQMPQSGPMGMMGVAPPPPLLPLQQQQMPMGGLGGLMGLFNPGGFEGAGASASGQATPDMPGGNGLMGGMGLNNLFG